VPTTPATTTRRIALLAILLCLGANARLTRADEPPADPATPPAEGGEEEDAGPPLTFPHGPEEDDVQIVRADGTIVHLYATNFVAPAALQASLETLLGLNAELGLTYKQFPAQNTLLIEGEEDLVDLAREAAVYFDVPTPQVFIEAKVVELTYTSNFEFGLDYTWSRDAVGPNTLFRGAEGFLPPPGFIQSGLPGGLPFQGTSLFFGFVGDKAEQFGLLDVALRAAQLEGKAEIISRPNIIATQGIPAEVVTSEQRQIFQFQSADFNQTRYGSSTLDTGVRLSVKPIHIGQSFVTLEVEPEVRGLQETSVLTAQTFQPTTTQRRAKTTVTMADGATLVIGGLYTSAKVNEDAKTPLLSDIPILGCLFTRTRETKVKTEIIIMLTPKILRKTSDFNVVTPKEEIERLTAEEPEDQIAPCPLCEPLPGRGRGPCPPRGGRCPPGTRASPPSPPPPAAGPAGALPSAAPPTAAPPPPAPAAPPAPVRRDPNAPLPPPRVLGAPAR
jgi:type II secretory pathway component GspD/PulD (secretin)